MGRFGDDIFQSVWTVDGEQIQSIDDIREDTKILHLSTIPLNENRKAYSLTKRNKGMNALMRDAALETWDLDGLNNTSGYVDPTSDLGIIGNEFAATNWNSLYEVANSKMYQHIGASKENWFKGEHARWQEKMKGRLDSHHLSHEFKL